MPTKIGQELGKISRFYRNNRRCGKAERGSKKEYRRTPLFWRWLYEALIDPAQCEAVHRMPPMPLPLPRPPKRCADRRHRLYPGGIFPAGGSAAQSHVHGTAHRAKRQALPYSCRRAAALAATVRSAAPADSIGFIRAAFYLRGGSAVQSHVHGTAHRTKRQALLQGCRRAAALAATV